VIRHDTSQRKIKNIIDFFSGTQIGEKTFQDIFLGLHKNALNRYEAVKPLDLTETVGFKRYKKKKLICTHCL